ncbi:MAG: carbohydrate-binding protein [Negativicutes bacterium]|nr:carbohydrate-binding protein [Negativicutes bacterium]
MSISSEYLSNGVAVSAVGPSPYNMVKIAYDGLLAKSGATKVYAHVGFNSGWENARDYPMAKTFDGFETTVFLHDGVASVNVCFRDAVGNWDNNSGANYSFSVEEESEYPATWYEHLGRDNLDHTYYWKE